MWLPRHFDPRMVKSATFDPQDHGIKSGLRDTLIFQCWESKHFDRASLAFAS
jgi:hypothetical protein